MYKAGLRKHITKQSRKKHYFTKTVRQHPRLPPFTSPCSDCGMLEGLGTVALIQKLIGNQCCGILWVLLFSVSTGCCVLNLRACSSQSKSCVLVTVLVLLLWRLTAHRYEIHSEESALKTCRKTKKNLSFCECSVESWIAFFLFC